MIPTEQLALSTMFFVSTFFIYEVIRKGNCMFTSDTRVGSSNNTSSKNTTFKGFAVSQRYAVVSGLWKLNDGIPRIGIANTEDANLVDKIICLRCAFKVSTTLCMHTAYTRNLMRLIYDRNLIEPNRNLFDFA